MKTIVINIPRISIKESILAEINKEDVLFAERIDYKKSKMTEVRKTMNTIKSAFNEAIGADIWGLIKPICRLFDMAARSIWGCLYTLMQAIGIPQLHCFSSLLATKSNNINSNLLPIDMNI